MRTFHSADPEAPDRLIHRARASANAKRDQPAQAVYVCSAYNGALLRDLREALDGVVWVESTEAPGMAPNGAEALAFAWLGYAFMRHQPGKLPAVTGAAGARVLGALYPA